jgi:hypothetical protein
LGLGLRLRQAGAPSGFGEEILQVLDAAFSLGDGAALDGEDDVARGAAANLDDASPIDDAVAAGAADGGTGDFAAFGIGLFNGDVLRMEVDEAIEDMFEPGVGVVAAEVTVAGVEVDAECGALDETEDAVEAVGMFRVLLVRFESNEDSPGFSDEGGLLDRVTHEHMIFGLCCPFGFGAFVGVDHRCAAFGGEADRLLKVFNADFRFAQRGMSGQSGQANAHLVAGAADAQGVIEHGDTVEIAGFAEQFATPMDHGFDVLVADFRGMFDAPLEVLVVVTYVFEVYTEKNVSHGNGSEDGTRDR